MSDQKTVTQFTRTVYSTEEFNDLQRYAEQAGATIVGTKAMSDGRGITVYLEMDGDKRQF
ncbi:hypothetical protein [Niallia sp. Krafla_26]|uniref:hypothetical protein n=1 Tax=Niallia sp. Krafla_26 TaxID=3064703 RepID=UPI003D16E4DC